MRNDVGLALDRAVVGVMEKYGQDNGLEPFDWRLVDYPDGPVIEGCPRIGTFDPVAATAQWAAALEMNEYSWDRESSPRTWYLEQGHWHIELVDRRT